MLHLVATLVVGFGAGPVPGVQLADEGVNAGQVTRLNCTGAGVSCTRTGTTATVTVTGGGGGGGSANVLNDSLTFAGGADATKVVSAAWATASSSVLCMPLDEEGSMERLQLVVVSRTSGAFTVRGAVPQGTHTGAFAFTCTGV